MKWEMKKCPLCEGEGEFPVLTDEVGYENAIGAGILEGVASKYGMPVKALVGPSRRKDLVQARNEAAYLMRNEGLSLKQIGRFLGRRDHSTIINCLRRYEGGVSHDL